MVHFPFLDGKDCAGGPVHYQVGSKPATTVNWSGTDESFTTIYRVDLNAQTVRPILGHTANTADYGPPKWAPDGQWLVVSQRVDNGTGDLSRPIWLMRLDGSEARAITNDPRVLSLVDSWDPWGTAVVFQQINIGEPFPKPSIKIWIRETGEIRSLAENAAWPAWLP